MPSSIEPHGGWHVVLALCSIVRRCVAACIAAGGASDVHVRACVRGVSFTRHIGLWLRCVLPAMQEPSPETCIIAAFAAHQWTSAVFHGRCI